jgi:hypothetical protein
MAKSKLINNIYNGVFDSMDVNQAEEFYQRAYGKYQDRIQEFNRLYELYKQPDSNGPYDKNIVFELIESEIDNNIYFPKVRSSNGRVEPAKELEDILKNELYDYKYREYNDLQERNTYIFGGAVTLVYWDRLSRNSARGGKLKFKAIDPRNFIPQPGVNSIEDMDYMFIIESCTKMSLANLYDLSTEDLEFCKSDTELNIDPDLITVKTMYYKDKYNHICRFTWSGSLVLENDDNIYSDKAFYCSKCGTIKEADEDECIKCGNTEFKLKSIERRKILVRLNSELQGPEGSEPITIPTETEIDVTPYVPNRFPIIIRKNISSGELFGLSDAEMIETSQKLNNSILNKIAERILKAGSIIALPKTLRNKFKVDNSELKLLYYDTPADANGIIVKTLQPQLGNETYLMDSAYATARQTLGITNTYQGREDNTAISSKAKMLQVQQTAGRLESKREMKKASLVSLFELMFQFILAYSYEYRGYYVTVEGEEQFKLYDNRLFLIDTDGKYFYDDEYTFDIDMSASYENDRQTMWEETRLNFSSGAYGDPQSLETLKMFWQTMNKLNYPGAKEALEYIETRLAIQSDQAEIENMYRSRELQLQQSKIATDDMTKDRESQAAANQANAKLLSALNNNE